MRTDQSELARQTQTLFLQHNYKLNGELPRYHLHGKPFMVRGPLMSKHQNPSFSKKLQVWLKGNHKRVTLHKPLPHDIPKEAIEEAVEIMFEIRPWVDGGTRMR